MAVIDTRKRILIKISGEAFKELYSGGHAVFLRNESFLAVFSAKIKLLIESNYQIILVNGGGNVLRGRENSYSFANKEYASLAKENSVNNSVRILADKIGMISTVSNSLILYHYLRQAGVKVFLRSFYPIRNIVREYWRDEAEKRINDGEVFIFSGGTGLPFFSNDSAAAIIGADLCADMIMMVKTGVDAVYTDETFVEKVKEITFSQMIKKQIKVIDLAAIEVCKGAKMRVFVCGVDRILEIFDFIRKEKEINELGTWVSV